ncbi:unnamed protein product [Parascedosporium putredinis]|uniref:t-SNARE coiled-coil homology domain-containing protein n=1 Tax=Parascedosporium putredinis TaxID=1442378 RepID=A0A9P1HAL3_9PEZI|nr:unnamed protein product [Parascedosporium putredinis]CAI8004127.1 unnamed protein product [Parascedosporium putredinis]
MSKPNQLFLLADHIKLSLLERQRAQSLNLEGNSQDGHISRSIEQFRDGLDALKKRSRGSGTKAMKTPPSTSPTPSPPSKNSSTTSPPNSTASPPSTTSTLTHPNDPSLASDFAHATTVPAAKSSSSPSPTATRSAPPAPPPPVTSPSASPTPPPATTATTTTITTPPSSSLLATATSRAPSGVDRAQGMTNEQIHAYHANVLDEQDEQLDRLGETIGRQRELSMRMGDELEAQIEILDETDAMVDRHQSRLDRALDMCRVAASAQAGPVWAVYQY